MKEKKIALFYGECTVRAVSICCQLSKKMNEEYDIYSFLSYENMTNVELEKFYNLLKVCDVYVYNYCILDKWKKHNENYLRELKKECKKISVPMIETSLYHVQAKNNHNRVNEYCVVSAKSPHAPFLSPDCNINKMLQQDKDFTEIYEIISDEEYYSNEELEKNFRLQVRKISREEENADVKVGDFIIKNHGKKRLMLNEMHVSNEVLIEYTRQIMNCLNLTYDLNEMEVLDKKIFRTTEVPIYPSVIKKYGLENVYNSDSYSMFTFNGEKIVTFREYLEIYCDYVKTIMRYMKLGYFPC